MQTVDRFANIRLMRNTRPISWLKAARKGLEEFSEAVQSDILDALTICRRGRQIGQGEAVQGG
ncbi:Phage-related protein (fragment) [Candidatus Methylobacter favarea]|uniref:Phage-related protein n=1 Tax=Candidatus Methylobacter favarea TaxID=2707345 RepID=A0A8S0X2V2_9GAMM